jgi:hypothetical protein
LKADGSKFFGDGYEFVPGKDETILEGTAGYIVTFGDVLYRSYDAVLRLRQEGLEVGLINKSTLNIVDEETTKKIGSSPFVLVVETLNQKTGVRFDRCPLSCHVDIQSLLARFQVWYLVARTWADPQVCVHGTHKEGCGGLQEQVPFQGLDSQCE